MKGRFQASWRIILALALLLSLSLMTAAPVMATVTLTSVVPLPCTANASANYTISFTNTVALNTSAAIYVYFPDAIAATLAGVSGATVDGTPTAAPVPDKYNVTDLYNNVLIITPGANVTVGPHLLVVQNVTNLCTAGAHTLKVWTTAETTQVSFTYTICADVAASITIAPKGSTTGANVTKTFTATAKDACGNSLGDVTASTVWSNNGTNYFTVNNFTSCVAGSYNITGTYGALTDWGLLTVTVGAAKTLAIITNPVDPTQCCANVTATLNATDICGNLVPGVLVTASLAVNPTGATLEGTKTATTTALGVASFTNLVIKKAGTGYVLNFAATGTAGANSTTFNITTCAASKLTLTGCTPSLTANTTRTFTANQTDSCGNDLGDVTSGTTFTIAAGANATVNVNNITPTKAGVWTVTGTNGTLTGTCSLTVTATTPVSLSLTPEITSIETGDCVTYTATTLDVFGNPTNVSSNPATIWSINLTAAGGSWSVNKYCSEHAGCFNVTVTYGALSDSAQLTVTPAMCFIATAAYGTPMAEQVQILREFRDKYMLTNPLGRALVGLYYRVSPPIAQFITEHPGLQPIVRAMLVPAVALSTIVVHNGVTLPLIVLGLVLISVALAIWATRRQRGSAYV